MSAVAFTGSCESCDGSCPWAAKGLRPFGTNSAAFLFHLDTSFPTAVTPSFKVRLSEKFGSSHASNEEFDCTSTTTTGFVYRY